MSWVESPRIDKLISGGIGAAAIGRYLENCFFYIIYGSVNHYQSLDFVRAVRFTGIISIALLAYVLFMIFKTNRIGVAYAFVGSILVCTLPPFQLYVSWLHGIDKICCCLLSALAGLFSFKVVIKENGRKSSYSISAIFLAVFFLLIALEIYQPASMFYWAVGVIPLAMLRDEDLTKNWHARFMIYFSVGFVSMIIYLLLTKIIQFVANLHSSNRGSFIGLTEIPWKIKFFLHRPLMDSLNLWNVFLSGKLGLIVGMIIIAGFLPGLRQAVLYATRERRSDLIWNHLQRIFLIAILIPLSFFPNLVVKENWAPYRTLVSIEATVCMLLFVSLLNIDYFLKSKSLLYDNFKKKLIPVTLTILTIFVIYSAHGNVEKYFTKIQSLDMEFVKNVIKEYGIHRLSDTSRIYVRESDKPYRMHDHFWYELGQPTSNEKWAITSVVKLALYELGIRKEIEITQGPADAPLPDYNNVLIVDFTKLKYFLDDRLGKDS